MPIMATATPYNPFLLSQLTGASKVDFDGDTIKVCLLTDSYTPDYDTHTYYSDLSSELASGDGYTTGGQTLISVSGSVNTTDNRSEIDANDPTWTFTANKTFRYMAYYKDSGLTTTSPLIGLVDFGAGGRTENGNFTVQFPTTGFFQLRSVTT